MVKNLNGVFSSETLELQFLSHSQEGIQIFLVNICFSMVDVVQDCIQVLRPNSFHINERMLVFVPWKRDLKMPG